MGQLGHRSEAFIAFLQNNQPEPDQPTQVMGHHPQYLQSFYRTHNFLLRGDGPLPYDYRHYIAIMAAGRHQCSYLINLQKQEFLLQGGDESWLKGLKYLPQKLRNLYEINKILAHRPWLINKGHIEKLTKGKESWSLAEVTHAIVLLSHFHALASFIHGCGIGSNSTVNNHISSHISEEGACNSMLQQNGTTYIEDCRSTHSTVSSYPEVRVSTLMKRMKSLSESIEEFTPDEKTLRYQRLERQLVELSPERGSVSVPSAEISQYIEDADFLYQDFAKRGEVNRISTFRVQDYSWDDHGYSLVNRLYSDVGHLLDEKFKTAYNLTYYTMGNLHDVDTSRFRTAIWNYIQCLYGIRWDDYDYGEVNHLLERPLKTFIKSVCCFPERVTAVDFNKVMSEFKHSEKVHVNIIVLEARLQAELLYALRTLMRYTT